MGSLKLALDTLRCGKNFVLRVCTNLPEIEKKQQQILGSFL